MRFTDPRTTIHEAYAVNLKLKESSGGTSPIDSSITAYKMMKVGLVIAEVEKQSPHIKHILVYLYAPDLYHSETAVEIIWERLQEDFHRKNKGRKFSPRQLAKLPSLAMRALSGIKMEQNSGRRRTQAELCIGLRIDSARTFRQTYGGDYKQMQTILNEYLAIGLEPVDILITEQRERIREGRLTSLKERLAKNKIPSKMAVEFVNSQRTGEKKHTRLNTISLAEADLIENQIVHVESVANTDPDVVAYMFQRGK